MNISPTDYHLYATLFDAILAVQPGNIIGVDVTIYGDAPAAALRHWGERRGIEVTPETRETNADGGQRMTWTALVALLPPHGGRITVSCGDTIYTPLGDVAITEPSQPASDEMPF